MPASHETLHNDSRKGTRRKKDACTRQYFRYLVVNFPTTIINKAGNLVDISNPLIFLCEQNPNAKHPPHTLHPYPIPTPLCKIFSFSPKIQQMPKKCE